MVILVSFYPKLQNVSKYVFLNFSFQNGLPARMKAFHIYNEPPLFDMIFGLISPLIKEKIKSRVS